MIGLDRAQRAYDRQEPDDDPEAEEPRIIEANELTECEILEFVNVWINAETNDENALEYITIEAWFCDLPLSYRARKWVENWARQAAYEAQFPVFLKKHGSNNLK